MVFADQGCGGTVEHVLRPVCLLHATARPRPADRAALPPHRPEFLSESVNGVRTDSMGHIGSRTAPRHAYTELG